MEAIFGTLWAPCLVTFLVGVALLSIELCIPGFGFAGSGGIVCFLAVIVMQYLTNSPTAATLVSLVMAAVIILLAVLLVRSFNRGILFRSPIVLKDRISGISCVTDQCDAESLLGRAAVVETTLRPTGTVRIDGKRYQAKACASFIEKGQTVHVCSVNGLDIEVE